VRLKLQIFFAETTAFDREKSKRVYRALINHVSNTKTFLSSFAPWYIFHSAHWKFRNMAWCNTYHYNFFNFSLQYNL